MSIMSISLKLLLVPNELRNTFSLPMLASSPDAYADTRCEIESGAANANVESAIGENLENSPL